MKYGLIVLLLVSFLGCNTQKNTQKNEKSIDAKVQVKEYRELSGELDPIANPKAVRGGVYNEAGAGFPKSINSWLDYNSFSVKITGLLFESLVNLHSLKNEPVGILAKSWTVSDDKKTFTFTIQEHALWSDGKPITAEDVQFYYDVIMDPKNKTSLFRVDLKRFQRPEIIDEKTIKITATTDHWSNFWAASGLVAFPKHIWRDVNFNEQNFEFPVVSGPYKMKEIKKNRYIILQRRDDWWGDALAYNQYKYNFGQIKYKFIEDRNKTLEAFKKGIFDAYSIYTSEIWVKNTHFEAVEKGWVVRQRVFNKSPIGFQGFAINMRREKFQDVKIRKALAHLINRELINEKLMFNAYFLHNSYYPDLYANNTKPDAPLVAFDPEQARKLFADAGYIVNARGLLEKNGQIFEVKILSGGTNLVRHITIIMEDMKKIGITVSIDQLSSSSVRKRLDTHDFDIYWINWNASRLRDPEAAWHSSTADEIATNNITGLKDPIVDSLIETQKNIMDIEKRNTILRALDDRLIALAPYALLWNNDNKRLLYWNKFGTPTYVLDKYNDEDAILVYWWIDPEKDKILKEGQKNNTKLNANHGDIYYKETP